MGNFSSTSSKFPLVVENRLIQNLISTNCVVVFSKTHCFYCKKVKKLFQENDVKYVTIELDEREDGRNLQEALSQLTGAKTVPRVFINGQCIGGASESEELYRQNKLMEKIRRCEIQNSSL